MHVPRGSWLVVGSCARRELRSCGEPAVPALSLHLSTVCVVRVQHAWGPFFTFGSVLGVCIMYQIT